MNDKNREWLSALTDGELEGHEMEVALDRLRKDADLQDSWKAYHLIRDTVTSNLEQSVDPQLHHRISAALESEPVILAPQHRRRPWIKQVAGVAIAASVTGMAIIGVQSMNSIDPAPAAVPMAKQEEYIRMEPRLVAREETKPAQSSDRLNSYLVNHNEFSNNSGIQGMLPYVRIVGHKEGQ